MPKLGFCCLQSSCSCHPTTLPQPSHNLMADHAYRCRWCHKPVFIKLSKSGPTEEMHFMLIVSNTSPCVHTVVCTHTHMHVCHEHTDISETEVSWNNALVSICNAFDFLFTSSSVYFINMIVKLSWIDLTSHQWAAALSLKIMCIPGFLSIITANLFSPPLPVYRGM